MAHLIRHGQQDASTAEAPGVSSSSSSSSTTSSDYSPRSSQTDSLPNETVLDLFSCTDPSSDRPSLESDRDLFVYDSYDSSAESGSTGKDGQPVSYGYDDSTFPTRVSSRAGSPAPVGPDPWEGYLGYRSRNRSRHASGTTTPSFHPSEKTSAEYYHAHYSQTSALLKKLGGIAAPENTPLGSPVLQHQKRRAGWWARRAEARSQTGSPDVKIHRTGRASRRRSCFSLFWSALLRQPWVPTQPLTILFFILLFGCFAATVTTFLTHVLSNDKQRLPWREYCQNQRAFPHELADSLAPVNVFVGVFSVDAAYERRQLIRSTYMRLSKPTDPLTGRPGQNVQVKFILGRPRPSHARRIALEMETFNDVVVLDLKENMNRGKTHSFFKWAQENASVPIFFRSDPSKPAQVGFKRADYVVKADDDTFLVLDELERHLRVTPRQLTYWGYLIRNLFMGGEVYALSADLVDYVASYPPLIAHSTGAEDKKVAKWMRMHPEAAQINWITERCYIYDHPKAGTTYSHGFLFPDEVERIRAEGRRGLSDDEKDQRGSSDSQSYSTVSKWKSDYQKPANDLTIEEEVEALIEGGGRWSSNAWKSSQTDAGYISSNLLLFDTTDERLVDPFADTFAALPPKQDLGIRPGVPDRSESIASARTTRFGKDLYRRPEDVEVMRISSRSLTESETDANDSAEGMRPGEIFNAVTPAVDEDLETAGSAVLDSQPFDSRDPDSNSSSTGKLHWPPATNYLRPADGHLRFLPHPTHRYDQGMLEVRQRRMLGKSHGGTVAVHYLKRNEWFYETSLALLGRHRTWDGGHDAPIFDARKPVDILDLSAQDVSDTISWRGVGKVEVVPAVWGSARMYGSPMVHPNGMISEGRPVISHLKKTIYPTPNHLGSLRGAPKLGFAIEKEGTAQNSDSAVQRGEASSDEGLIVQE